jgi:hypothetical protein
VEEARPDHLHRRVGLAADQPLCGGPRPRCGPVPGLDRWRTLEAHKAACQQLGITNYTQHDARHSYAIHAVRCGASYEHVAGQLGHGNTQMAIKVYARCSPSARERTAWEKRSAIIERQEQAAEARARPEVRRRTSPSTKPQRAPLSQVETLPASDRGRLAACPRTHPDILEELSNDVDARVRAAYVQNSAADVIMVGLMHIDDALIVRRALVRRRLLTDDAMRHLVFDPVEEIRCMLLRRRDLDEDALKELTSDRNMNIRVVAKHRLQELRQARNGGAVHA